METTGRILSKVGKGKIVSKKPLLIGIKPKRSLTGKLNIGTRKIIELVSFAPYVEKTTLYFRTQASVSESKLTIRG